jgi:hypothetical protein
LVIVCDWDDGFSVKSNVGFFLREKTRAPFITAFYPEKAKDRKKKLKVRFA